MKLRTFVPSAMAAILTVTYAAGTAAQGTGTADTVDAHVAAAKALAANEQTALITLCDPPATPAARGNPPARGGQPPAPPDRSRWTREPMKVFDNLYYVGEKEYSSWAVVTSAGIIIIDAIYDYSVEEQVAGGLKKLGLDISDRIALRYAGPIARAFERHGDFIKQEALATSLSEGLHDRGHKWEGELNGVAGKIEIERA